MDEQLLTPAAFAQSIKAKYPDYASVPDEELAAKMLEKYPEYRAHVRETPNFTTANDPNTLGTFASHVGAQINPVTAVKGLTNAVLHPIDTVKGIGAAQGAVFDKAKASYASGDYSTAARHFVDYLLPLVGPVIDKSADDMQAGHIMSGAGDAVGLGLAMFGPEAIGRAAMPAAAPKFLPDAARTAKPGLITNRNPAEVAAVKFGQARGIPVDAGTASGNAAIKGVQGMSDRSLGGSMVAQKAAQVRAEALSRVGGDLATDARAVAVTPEQAGQGIRDALASKLQAHTALADSAYERLRALEAEPTNRISVAKVPEAVDALPSHIKAQLRRIVHEMDASGYSSSKLVKNLDGPDHYVPRSGGAKVYDDITQQLGQTLTRGTIQSELEEFLGGGKETPTVKAAVAVAKERYMGRNGVSTPELPANVMQMETRLEKGRVTTQEMGLPVDTTAAKTALKPVYDEMMRQMPLTQQQSSAGLQAMRNILEGPDMAPLSQVDRDLSAIKSVARTKGGLAKFAAAKLDAAVKQAAANGSPDVMRSLETGRQATIGKVTTEDLINALPGGKMEEPLAVFKRATAPADAGIEFLRTLKSHTPQALPQVARAKLDELLTMGPDKMHAEWTKLGRETKQLLFPQSGQTQSLDHFFLLSKKLAENMNPSGSGQAWMRLAEGAGFWANPVTFVAAEIGTAGLSAILHSPKGVPVLTRAVSLALKPATATTAAKAATVTELAAAAKAVGVQLRALPKAAGIPPVPRSPDQTRP